MDINLLVLCHRSVSRDAIDALRGYGIVAHYVDSLRQAVQHLLAKSPDAILIAVNRPDEAQDDCAMLRALSSVGIIVASTDGDDETAATCLDEGADSVCRYPAAPSELHARIQAVVGRVGRATRHNPRRLLSADHAVEIDERGVRRNGRLVNLSPIEQHLLDVLAENPGSVVSNRDLLVRVWGEEYADDVQYVRLYIGYLRAKLEDDPRRPQIILNQWGVGYRLAVEQCPTSPLANGSAGQDRYEG